MRGHQRSSASRRAVALAVGVLAIVTTAGCVATPPETPIAGGVTVPDTLVSQNPMTRVAHAMVRFRTVMCGGVYSGSGFAIDAHHIVTNRHVVGGASTIDAESWDGVALHVTNTRISPDNDLAVVTVSNTLAAPLHRSTDEPAAGIPITAVGYPLGNALRFDKGKVIEDTDGDGEDQQSRTVLIDARIRHGNSGGPLVDDDGTVVGVVYRFVSLAESTGMAIPASTLDHVLKSDDLVKNPSCAPFTVTYGSN